MGRYRSEQSSDRIRFLSMITRKLSLLLKGNCYRSIHGLYLDDFVLSFLIFLLLPNFITIQEVCQEYVIAASRFISIAVCTMGIVYDVFNPR